MNPLHEDCREKNTQSSSGTVGINKINSYVPSHYLRAFTTVTLTVLSEEFCGATTGV